MTPITDPNALEVAVKRLIEVCGGTAPEAIKWHAARDINKGHSWLVEYTNGGVKRCGYSE